MPPNKQSGWSPPPPLPSRVSRVRFEDEVLPKVVYTPPAQTAETHHHHETNHHHDHHHGHHHGHHDHHHDYHGPSTNAHVHHHTHSVPRPNHQHSHSYDPTSTYKARPERFYYEYTETEEFVDAVATAIQAKEKSKDTSDCVIVTDEGKSTTRCHKDEIRRHSRVFDEEIKRKDKGYGEKVLLYHHDLSKAGVTAIMKYIYDDKYKLQRDDDGNIQIQSVVDAWKASHKLKMQAFRAKMFEAISKEVASGKNRKMNTSNIITILSNFYLVSNQWDKNKIADTITLSLGNYSPSNWWSSIPLVKIINGDFYCHLAGLTFSRLTRFFCKDCGIDIRDAPGYCIVCGNNL